MQGVQQQVRHSEAEIGRPAESPAAGFFQKLVFFAAALLTAAALADLVGVVLRASWLTRAGAQVCVVGIVLGSICLVWWLALRNTTRRGWMLWTFALVCFGLARWVRGSAGVPPDAPLVGVEVIGVVLALVAVW